MLSLSDESEDELFNLSSNEDDTLLKSNGRKPVDEKLSGKAWGRVKNVFTRRRNYPCSIWLILGTEFCERFSYYGMRAILILYLTKWLKFEPDSATAIYHSFSMLCYFSPILGAILADGYIGRFKTILSLSVAYAIGNLVMSTTALPPPEWIGPMIGLLLIGFGTGGIKPCVSAFGADQFHPGQEKERNTFFSAFYFMINLGSLFSILLTPILRADVQCFGNDCYPLAFGVPAVLMFISALLFIAGSSLYKKTPPTGNLFGRVAKCIYLGIKGKCSSSTKVREHWLDHAEVHFEQDFIEEMKGLLKVLVLFLPLPLFWALYDQQGSRWTLQAEQMDGNMGVFGTLKPDQLQGLNPLLIILLIPFFEKLVYPLCDRCNMLNRPLQRMVIGMFLTAISFIIAAFIQIKLENQTEVALSSGESGVTIINSAPCSLTVNSTFYKHQISSLQMSFGWAKIRGCPVYWPVKVICEHANVSEVYLKSDHAELKVEKAKVLPFPGGFDDLKQRGIVTLKKKKQLKSLKCFLDDVEWALLSTAPKNKPVDASKTSKNKKKKSKKKMNKQQELLDKQMQQMQESEEEKPSEAAQDEESLAGEEMANNSPADKPEENTENNQNDMDITEVQNDNTDADMLKEKNSTIVNNIENMQQNDLDRNESENSDNRDVINLNIKIFNEEITSDPQEVKQNEQEILMCNGCESKESSECGSKNSCLDMEHQAVSCNNSIENDGKMEQTLEVNDNDSKDSTKQNDNNQQAAVDNQSQCDKTTNSTAQHLESTEEISSYNTTSRSNQYPAYDYVLDQTGTPSQPMNTITFDETTSECHELLIIELPDTSAAESFVLDQMVSALQQEQFKCSNSSQELVKSSALEAKVSSHQHVESFENSPIDISCSLDDDVITIDSDYWPSDDENSNLEMNKFVDIISTCGIKVEDNNLSTSGLKEVTVPTTENNDEEYDIDTPSTRSEENSDTKRSGKKKYKRIRIESSDSEDDDDERRKVKLSRNDVQDKGDTEKEYIESKMPDEDSLMRDQTNRNIYIRKVLKSAETNTKQKKTGLRVYNSYQYCFYCNESIQHIQPHLKSKHRNISQIANLLKYEKEDKSKFSKELELLRLRGNDKHNQKVLKDGKGEIVVKRRPNNVFNVADYGPCPDCKDWVKKKCIQRHKPKCPVSALGDQKANKRTLQLQSDIISGRLQTTASQQLVKEVFTIMTKDVVSETAQADSLITALGESWLRRSIDNQQKRAQYTSQHMRLCAKFLLELRNIQSSINQGKSMDLDDGKNSASPGPSSERQDISDDGSQLSMWDFLQPSQFDKLVTAAISVSLPLMDDDDELKSPSNAIKMKYDLIRLINAKWAFLTKSGDNSVNTKKCENLLKLIKIEWAERVTKIARNVLVKRQFSLSKEIPAPKDIKTLNNHVISELEKVDSSAKKDIDTYLYVTALVQTRLLVYNKRRSGEIDGIRLKDYASRKSHLNDVDESLVGELSDLEKYLLESQNLMKVRGKRNRPVPVLLPNDVQPALAYLADSEVRKAVKINTKNFYLFANSANGVVRSYDSLKKICSKINSMHPERITSQTLRKYTATLSQVMNLDQNQVQWVCKHLGHTRRVHLEHYQNMSGYIERVEISKLLLIQDLNLTKKFIGKQLSDISLEDVMSASTSNEEVKENPLVEIDENEQAELEPSQPGNTEYSFEDDNPSDTGNKGKSSQKKQRKKPIQTKKTPWSKEEHQELEELFGEYLRTRTCPGQKACLIAMKKSKDRGGVIYKRSYHTIVKKISNMNKKRGKDHKRL